MIKPSTRLSRDTLDRMLDLAAQGITQLIHHQREAPS